MLPIADCLTAARRSRSSMRNPFAEGAESELHLRFGRSRALTTFRSNYAIAAAGFAFASARLTKSEPPDGGESMINRLSQHSLLTLCRFSRFSLWKFSRLIAGRFARFRRPPLEAPTDGQCNCTHHRLPPNFKHNERTIQSRIKNEILNSRVLSGIGFCIELLSG